MSQINVNTIADSSGSNAITFNTILGASQHYRSVVFPDANGNNAWDGASGGSMDAYTSIGNTITATKSHDNSGSDIQNYGTIWTIGGLTNGIYEFSAYASHDRTSNSSNSSLLIKLTEGGSAVARALGNGETQLYTNVSMSGQIRDYTSTVPTVKIEFYCNHSNYAVNIGCGFTVRRIA